MPGQDVAMQPWNQHIHLTLLCLALPFTLLLAVGSVKGVHFVPTALPRTARYSNQKLTPFTCLDGSDTELYGAFGLAGLAACVAGVDGSRQFCSTAEKGTGYFLIWQVPKLVL